MKRNHIVIIVVILIIAAIIGIESLKPKQAVGEAKEISVIETQQLPTLQQDNESATPQLSAFAQARLDRIKQKESQYPKAIELVQPDGYINTDPFNISDYIGKKVIIVDFWTYSCINCQRTLPYLNAWHKQYEDDGLLIIGVHTPEFDFEKDHENVVRAVEKYGVEYPVVQDNEFRTWRAYNNRYWPHKYFIDIDGFIVSDHIGEGGYEESEEIIRTLLFERKQALHESGAIADAPAAEQMPQKSNEARTAEVYFGYGLGRDQIGNSGGWRREEAFTYSLPAYREAGKFYLDGTWLSSRESITPATQGKLVLDFDAQSINLVAGSTTPVQMSATIDGVTKTITIDGHDLYSLYEGTPGQHTVVLDVPAGVELFTFTFG